MMETCGGTTPEQPLAATVTGFYRVFTGFLRALPSFTTPSCRRTGSQDILTGFSSNIYWVFTGFLWASFRFIVLLSGFDVFLLASLPTTWIPFPMSDWVLIALFNNLDRVHQTLIKTAGVSAFSPSCFKYLFGNCKRLDCRPWRRLTAFDESCVGFLLFFLRAGCIAGGYRVFFCFDEV